MQQAEFGGENYHYEYTATNGNSTTDGANSNAFMSNGTDFCSRFNVYKIKGIIMTMLRNNEEPWISKIFSIYVLTVLLIFSATSYAATININTTKTNLALGESFNVYFNISGLSSNPADSLSGFDLDVLYDQNVLAFVGSTFSDPVLGNQLDFNELGALPFFGDVDNLGNGMLDAFGISGNSGNVLDANQSDQFAFLGLTFTAIGLAQSTSISINLNDPFLMFLDSNADDLAVNISRHDLAISIPEPNILLLVAVGVLMLLVSSFKYRRFQFAYQKTN